jgi:glycosyltransferase involved in cell wall biosynthesis
MMTRRLRVAIVAPTLEILGGHSVEADRMLRGWRDDPDVDAWLVPIDPRPTGALRLATRLKYIRTVVTEMLYIPLLVRELRRADVVHIFSASYSSFLLAPLPAVVVAKALNKPVVLNYHSGEAPDHLSRSRLAREVLARVDRNVVPSAFLRDVFRRFGLDADMVSNTVDLEAFPFRERDPLRPKLLSTRNFGYPYNVAATLRAFAEVQRRVPAASLTLVGSGPDEPKLRALASGLQLTNVTFAGRVAPENIPAYYAAHDIYIQSPDLDNMPLSILEAFASGLPVVSTDVGGVSAMLTNERHGLLAGAGDHEELAAQVCRLLDDPARARKMARAAYQTCRNSTWGQVRDQWLRIYRSLSRDAHALLRPGVEW